MFKNNKMNSIFEKVVLHMYQPKDPSSLGVIRILFGILMILDLPEERGGSEIFKRYGDPRDCHFPLFNNLQPFSYELMSVLYGLMFLGALGMTLGFYFRTSVLMMAVPYWYIFLIDKSFWNNHTYLYGILLILLLGSSANHYWSVDALLDENIRGKPVPYWNYWILKFQFFVLYFLAGVKKSDWEWLEGYSMRDMGNHWVFFPFSFFLTTEQIDHLIIHWFGFLLDLTIGFWMIIEFTRPVAMLFCALFHLMNSRMFSIGMFPYVCLATMPLFCEENWPRKITKCLNSKSKHEFLKPSNVDEVSEFKITWKHRLVVCLLFSHCTIQGILPFSHSVTKGYNNWTKGLYGYSWDMMIHGWDTILVVVKVVDTENGHEYFLDSSAWTLNDRWTKHADMCLQYAQCVKKNLYSDPVKPMISENISIYIDVWCSMNNRIQQRMFNPHYDLLRARWSPFEDVEWLLPLLSEYNNFREDIEDISKHVHSWSNFSEVIFVSDFPGLHLENYVSDDLRNVSLTVLKGTVSYERKDNGKTKTSELLKGDQISVTTENFHKIHTMGTEPSFYMYTYVNATKESTKLSESNHRLGMYSPFPFLEDVSHKLKSFEKMFHHIHVGITHLIKFIH